ncbi:somatostatin receptor type 5-like [Argopecten irradians]|uniref:somatostatin receptor type 5-like n=1 Tax=Argopecten irradians TaxID=31199 RepID=UPI003712740F
MLNSSWTSNHPIYNDTMLNSSWTSNQPIGNDTMLNSSWTSNQPIGNDTMLNSSWTSNQRIGNDTMLNSSWTSNQPIGNDTILNSSWTPNKPIGNDTMLNSSWTSNQPIYNDTMLNSSWTSNQPIGNDTILNSSWTPNKPIGNDTMLNSPWTSNQLVSIGNDSLLNSSWTPTSQLVFIGNRSLWNSLSTINQSIRVGNSSHCNNSSTVNQTTVVAIDGGMSWVSLYMLPIICLFGLVGNSLSCIVMARLSRVSSFYLYTTVLALSDSAVLIFGGVMVWIDKIGLVQIPYFSVGVLYHPLFVCFVVFSQFSSWITVVMCVDRYIAVCHPMRVSSLCTRKRASITMICLFLALFALNSPLVCFVFSDDTCCQFPAMPAEFYNEYFTKTDLPTYSLIPMLIISVLSLLILRRVCIANKRRQQLSNNLSKHKMNVSTLKTIFVLMAIVLVFLTTILPFLCIQCYVIVAETYTCIAKELNPNIGILSLMNHALNFVVYGLSGDTFRNELLRSVCRRRS